jgi:DNA-directed RNA polymerase alpha subunit
LRSFGKTSLLEVKRKLSDSGLALGMDVNRILGPGRELIGADA